MKFREISHKKYLLFLSTLFLIEFIILAISPYDREDWILENVLVGAGLLFLFATYKKLTLSRVSYTFIFIFLFFHEIGAHYTYAKVPYNEWSQELLGFSINEVLGWERNNFDRVVHFLYGLLLAYPIREMFFRIAQLKGFWGYFLPLDFTMSTSMIFELIEWAGATVFGGDLGVAYLGIQGDMWDAHKDMLLASIGALIAMSITAGINFYLQKDFTKEFLESIKIKHKEPLGEDEIARLLAEKKKQ